MAPEPTHGPLAATLTDATRVRLASQLDILTVVLAGAAPGDLAWSPSPGRWSAHDNLAHLTRHHDVFLARLERILSERRPLLGRYRAEEDGEWPRWRGLSTEQVLGHLRSLRGHLVRRLGGLHDEDLARTGIHPVLGEMAIPMWTEFFLLHEGHHLYVILTRLGEARKASLPVG